MSIEEQSNWLSRLSFWWTNQIIDFGNNKVFSNKDLFETRADEQFKHSDSRFRTFFSRNKSIYKSLFFCIWRPMGVSLLFLLVGGVVQFGGPLLMKEILMYLQGIRYTAFDAYMLSICFFLIFFARVFFTQHGYH